MKTALTIAGSDSGGGAGIQADLKTFSALGVFGMSAITAITAQNTVEVRSVQNIDLDMISDQIAAVFDDIGVDAVKIGMLGTSAIIKTVAKSLIKYKPEHVVLDPVMVSKGGHHLLERNAVAELNEMLLPLSSLVTPNIPEAEILSSRKINSEPDMYKACRDIMEKGPKAVLIKGGHLDGDPNDLFYDGKQFHLFKGERVETKNVHGTGCTLSSAIAAHLAKGESMLTAIGNAKDYITAAIAESLDIGQGHGPANHFHHFYEQVY
ncbi:bifunctional hydroxymethylpyrimidine kinase/phosphomethylpyrimidine kinase [Siminovitchia fortis]|uniref:Hydroxymethylpyrimidine/phosphomethylpyrimidine kinase n=1 Tax=Siminovitchia fortis TaxID=254758 RepID=A0A443IR24_9BACI|nr:bifunctional hydroxymethylpyrimidine kinase/phosphomethylpyrimidine kinase [Siminovitchia fortis]RWR08594.1 bifunctional hydroxymethylpyrimidine kinase/phosphomethylpyrimidine kinase [Siminovitchia fortis]WHY83167.1 bifunctional hydroxymethylpyrimidine kinase/phosphomethylpyrimidine kinase [Siminovitchia fortis]